MVFKPTQGSWILLWMFLFFSMPVLAQQESSIHAPDIILNGIRTTVQVTSPGLTDSTLATYSLSIGQQSFDLQFTGTPGEAETGVLLDNAGPLEAVLLRNGEEQARSEVRAIPGWLSIVPPLLAILIALLFKRVIPALFLGIWIGAWSVYGNGLAGMFAGLLDTMQVYVRNAVADPDHVSIMLFTFMIGGMVGIISKNGGTQGIVDKVVGWARTARRGQLATWFLGLAIFFDDYANTLVVGKTMRPVTDSLRISREKLAYIVDSTAAPVACIAFATTWIGYEVGLIGTSLEAITGLDESPYSIFLNSIAYSFYPILALFFVFLVAFTQRDFGPMYRAEIRARTTGALGNQSVHAEDDDAEEKMLTPKEGKPRRAVNAIIPIVVLVVGVLLGLFFTGEGETFSEIVGSADSYKALMWASLGGVLAAIIVSISQRILTLEESIEAWYAGLKSMLFAMIILVLAWSLSAVTGVLHTADFLVSVLGDALNPGVIPTLVFFLAAATGFATGSSWGAMGILMPLVLPLTWAVLQANGMADVAHYHILYSTVSCVLAGSVWGDHCSPISDTTILSSMASSCDHIDHVRTQLPYALLVGGVAILVGTLPVGFGLPWWVGMGGAAIILFGVIRYVGKPVPVA